MKSKSKGKSQKLSLFKKEKESKEELEKKYQKDYQDIINNVNIPLDYCDARTIIDQNNTAGALSFGIGF